MKDSLSADCTLLFYYSFDPRYWDLLLFASFAFCHLVVPPNVSSDKRVYRFLVALVLTGLFFVEIISPRFAVYLPLAVRQTAFTPNHLRAVFDINRH